MVLEKFDRAKEGEEVEGVVEAPVVGLVVSSEMMAALRLPQS